MTNPSVDIPEVPLKACPHCGGMAVMSHGFRNGTVYWYIVCDSGDCFASAQHSDPLKLEAAWNRRITPSSDACIHTPVDNFIDEEATYSDQLANRDDEGVLPPWPERPNCYCNGTMLPHPLAVCCTAAPQPSSDASKSDAPTEFAWLIERVDCAGLAPAYWDGRGKTFMRDVNNAVRFSRREDAERVAAWMLPNEPVAAREHGWMPNRIDGRADAKHDQVTQPDTVGRDVGASDERLKQLAERIALRLNADMWSAPEAILAVLKDELGGQK